MKNQINHIVLSISKVDQRHFKLALIFISLALFVIGAGAPACGGEIGR
jgi:hypothetical protein